MKCLRCQAENPADAVFCQECGAGLEAACPSCGESNRLGAKFCKKCGQTLAQVSRIGGRQVLRLTRNPATEVLYERVAHALAV